MTPLPYVYKCVNRETGQFYFGYRSRNKVPAEQDLGVHYFTSSKLVRPIFDQFVFEILQLHQTKVEAHAAEQKLIAENWSNPLLLNKSLFPKIRNSGQTEYQKQKARERMLTANPMKLPHNIEAARKRATGKQQSDETKAKRALKQAGRKYPNRKKIDQTGKNNPGATHYQFTSPEGIVFDVIANFKQFCLDNNLGHNSCLNVAKGRKPSYKGWTIKLISKSNLIYP